MISNLESRLRTLAMAGSISHVKPGSSRVRVKLLDRVSAWMPLLMPAGKMLKVWWQPEVGDQVLVISPSGNADCGFAIAGIYGGECGEPGTKDTVVAEFKDGSRLEYNTAEHRLSVSVNGDVDLACNNAAIDANSIDLSAGSVSIGGGSVSISGNVQLDGSVKINGVTQVGE